MSRRGLTHDFLDKEIKRIQYDLGHSVHLIEATNTHHAGQDRVSCTESTTKTPLVMNTSSSVKSSGGLKGFNSYISSDDEDEGEEMDDRIEKDDECRIEIKSLEEPIFMDAPKNLDPKGTCLHRTMKGRPAYYDMDDDEYEKEFSGAYEQIHETIANSISSNITSHFIYNRLKVQRVDMESDAARSTNICQQDSGENNGVTNLQSFVTTNTHHRTSRHQLQDSYNSEKSCIKKTHGISRRGQSTAVTRIHDSFDSSSSLEMSRIVDDDDRGCEDCRLMSTKESYKALTPAVSNKTRNRTNYNLTSSSDCLHGSPSSVSSETTTCKGRWVEKSTKSNNGKERWSSDKDYSRVLKSDDASSSMIVVSSGVRRLTYRPPNHSPLTTAPVQTNGCNYSITTNKKNANEQQRLMQQLRWKEKWYDERDHRFKSVSSSYEVRRGLNSDADSVYVDTCKGVNASVVKEKKSKGKVTDDDVPFDEKY